MRGFVAALAGLAVAGIAAAGVLLLRRKPALSPPAGSELSNEEIRARIRSAYPEVSSDLAAEIVRVAGVVGAHPFDLANLIGFETAYTFDPKIENGGCVARFGPRSGRCAVGLIQFMPATAAEVLGWSPEGDTGKYTDGQKLQAFARMAAKTDVQQMAYVESYLRQWARSKGPLNTPYRLYMAVFYPAAINTDPDASFPADVQAWNPGISTPRDYVETNNARARLPTGEELGHA